MKSPTIVLFIVALAAFASESLVTWLLKYLPHLSDFYNALLDATFSSALVAPVLYFMLFRPMAKHIRERERMKAILLKNKEEQFKKMIHSSLDGFWLVDEQGQFLEVNEAYCQLLGYSREELLTMRLQSVQVISAEIQAWMANAQTAQHHHFETRQRCKDGRMVEVEASVNRSMDRAGQVYGFVHDISRRKQIEEELRLSAQLLNSTSDSVFLLDMQGNFVYMNEAAYKSRGYEKEELMAMGLRQLNDPSMNPMVKTRMEMVRQQGSAFFESLHRRRDGSVMPVEINAKLTESEGRILVLSVIRDITERKGAEKMLRESEARLKELFENLSSGVVVCRAEAQKFTIVAFNQAAERIENATRNSVLGQQVLAVFPELQRSGIGAALQRVTTTGVSEHLPAMLYHHGRAVEWREYYLYQLSNDEVVMIYEDVTQEKQAEAQMYHLAHYDALTNLPNRTLLSDRLQQALAFARRNNTCLALMFIDLDKFKQVNDTLGHDAGDVLLKEVAQRLQGVLRESDTVSRLGGDEFVVLLSVIERAQDALFTAEKILYALNQPFELFENEANISGSIGVSVYPEHGSSEKELIKHADMAMYYAKKHGRSNVTLFEAHMDGTTQD